MKKLNLRKFKQELYKKIKILKPKERHKTFSCAIFENISPEWTVDSSTPLIIHEIRTAVCHAEDIKRNFLEFYWIKKIKQNYVEVIPLANKKQIFTFYIDSVCLIPLEIIPMHIKMKLIHAGDDIAVLKTKRKIRKKNNV